MTETYTFARRGEGKRCARMCEARTGGGWKVTRQQGNTNFNRVRQGYTTQQLEKNTVMQLIDRIANVAALNRLYILASAYTKREQRQTRKYEVLVCALFVLGICSKNSHRKDSGHIEPIKLPLSHRRPRLKHLAHVGNAPGHVFMFSSS